MSKYLVNFVHIHEYHYCESADCIVGGHTMRNSNAEGQREEFKAFSLQLKSIKLVLCS